MTGPTRLLHTLRCWFSDILVISKTRYGKTGLLDGKTCVMMIIFRTFWSHYLTFLAGAYSGCPYLLVPVLYDSIMWRAGSMCITAVCAAYWGERRLFGAWYGSLARSIISTLIFSIGILLGLPYSGHHEGLSPDRILVTSTVVFIIIIHIEPFFAGSLMQHSGHIIHYFSVILSFSVFTVLVIFVEGAGNY